MKSILNMFLICTILLASSFVYGSNVDIQTIGKEYLQVSKSLRVKLETFDIMEHEEYREWKMRLVLTDKTKILDIKYPIDADPYNTNTFYFVPIKDGKYLIDLDKDGSKEFAVVYDHGGNAPATSVILFSVIKGKLIVFKKAWYAMEGGRSVIWNEKEVPKKCFYTQEGACEFL